MQMGEYFKRKEHRERFFSAKQILIKAHSPQLKDSHFLQRALDRPSGCGRLGFNTPGSTPVRGINGHASWEWHFMLGWLCAAPDNELPALCTQHHHIKQGLGFAAPQVRGLTQETLQRNAWNQMLVPSLVHLGKVPSARPLRRTGSQATPPHWSQPLFGIYFHLFGSPQQHS